MWREMVARAQVPCAVLRAQFAVGDLVNQTSFAVLRHPRAHMGAEPPVQPVQVADLAVRREAAKDCEAPARAKLARMPWRVGMNSDCVER